MVSLGNVFRTGTEAGRHFQVPMRLLNIGLIIIGIMYLAVACSVESTYTVQSEQQLETTLVQQAQPEIAAPPTPPVVVDYQVKWTEVQGFDPFTIPVEEGIYDAQHAYSPTRSTYARKILPRLEGLFPSSVAAVRSEDTRDVVLVSLFGSGTYTLLSVDGEKSWCMLSLLPLVWKGNPGGDGVLNDPRVVVLGNEIHLYGQDARPATTGGKR